MKPRAWGELIQLLRPIYARRLGGLMLALLCALVTVAAGVGLLGVSGWFLTGAALAGAGVTFNLFAPSALVRGLSFLRIVSRYAERVVGHATTLWLQADLRVLIFRALTRLTPRQLAAYRDGDLVSRMMGDVDALDTVFLFVLAPLVTAVLSAVVMTVVLGYWVPSAGWALAVALWCVCVGLPGWLMRSGRLPGEMVQESAAEVRAAVLDSVTGHADLVALHAQTQTQQHFEQLCQRHAQARYTQARVMVRGQAVLQGIAGLAVLSTLWFGLGAYEQGNLTGPWLVGLLLAVIGVFEVAGPIMRGAARIGSALTAARRVREVTHGEPDQHDPVHPVPMPEEGVLSMEDIWFSYPSAHAVAQPNGALLQGIHLRIAPGERVAIEGASGVGKSTLLHLLLRLETPQSGQLRYAACEAGHCTQAAWHQRIGLLSQHAPVFMGTLRSNVLIGDAQAEEAAVWQALDAARLGDFVRTLPDGLDTWVGETGSQLSAGQARRLCLARALLSPARVLVFDEPTAGLDAATESAFLQDLASAVQARAVVLVTHAALPPGAVQRRYRLAAGKLHEINASLAAEILA